MKGMRLIVASLAAIPALVGCGADGSGAHAGDAGGSPPSGAADSAPGSDSIAPTPEHAYGGRVVLEESDQGKDVFFATAKFARSEDRVLLEGCTDVPLASGSCCFLAGVTSSVAGGGGGVSAGSISFAGNGAALGELSFGPDGYTPLVNPPAFALSWMAGDTLQVTATGDVVGSFSGSVVAPDMPQILSLPEPHGSVLSMSIAEASSNPTFYTWAPAGPAGAKILFVLVDEGTGTLKCLADDAAGALRLPPDLVSPNFRAGDDGYLYIGRLLSGQAPENAQVEIASFAVVVWGFLFTK
jgi:hypothetical protein